MRALVCRQYGHFDELVIEDRDDPVPGDDEILFEVRAAALNFADLLAIAGKYQVRTPPPFIPGNEAAGVVTAVGRNVTRFAVGDPVIGALRGGAFAERAIIREPYALALPERLDFAEGAAYSVAYGTGYHALKQGARLQPGENFDGAEAVGTGLDLATPRNAIIGHDIGETAAAAVQELAALDHQDVAELREQDACRQALVLPEAGRALPDEAHPAGHLVVDDLGGHGDEPAVVALAAGGDFGGHADREIVGVALRNHRIDLEARQVDDGHDGHVTRDGCLLIEEQVADHAVDRRLDREVVDLAAQVLDDALQRLARLPVLAI